MPGSFQFEGMKPPLRDGADLQRKIQLLEGDRSAYYESSQSTIRKNKDTILQLRQENTRLHKKLADALTGDDHVIKDAFQSRGVEMVAFRNKSGRAALDVLDQKVCEKKKKLNALKHSAETRRRRLVGLQQQYNGAQPEPRASRLAPVSREEEAKNVRMLENRLEKAQLKCQEAEHIMRSYLKLKAHLQEESLMFQSQLDSMEAEILRQRLELQDLQVMKNDAHLSKDIAKAELQRQEEEVHRERRVREGNLICFKKQAEELKSLSEKMEKRAQRAIVHPDEMSSEAQRSADIANEEDDVIHTFEQAFCLIREATGATDTREVVKRFISQGATQKHLEALKVENERLLERLKEQEVQMHSQLQDQKFSGEDQLSSRKQMLEECKAHLRREQQTCAQAREQLECVTRTLSAAHAGVDHLCDKLQHVRMKGRPPKTLLCPKSDEFVLELLPQVELRLMTLVEQLQGKDLMVLMKEMEEEEFHTSIEGKLPEYNMRIKIPEVQRQDPYDEEESGDDEGDIITRVVLKRQSQIIIDSKTKRKTRTKKKKGKP